MQSRLAVAKIKRVVASSSSSREVFWGRRIGGGSFATKSGPTADPAIHSEEPEEVDANEALRDWKSRQQQAQHPSTKDDEAYVTPKSPIQSQSAPKIEHAGVGSQVDPLGQQRRRNTSSSAALDDISCVGLDGSPWPAEEKETSMKEQRQEQHEDQKEYFKHHKASPLSEIEIVDSRKPITRATDGTADSETFDYDGEMTWRPEQLDTAEEALRRAMEIFKTNAMRGDPDSPHGRALRELRGEDW